MKINEVAKLTKLPISTLRYYDDLGLTCHVTRDDRGQRIFTTQAVQWLKKMTCLRESGMSLKLIQQYAKLTDTDSSSTMQRTKLLMQQRQQIESQMAELQHSLTIIDQELQQPTFVTNQQEE